MGRGVSETSIGIPHAGRYDGIPPEKIGNKKTTELIGGFIPYEQTLFDTIASIRERETGAHSAPGCLLRRQAEILEDLIECINTQQRKLEQRWYWSLRRQHGLELVVVCLCDVFGPLLQQTMNTSNEYLKLWKVPRILC
ncbi:hypothetical protein SELMODRAFT_415559 [Selaginella moellendorffii]|uniref:Uncharacterized protein n=1 Tax=Selaginella moellendorffii TaxID=88036 RepID=D8RWI4_SELML|nr:hypothetical protein SELMODRAFT_415559 [Selaginella moellendorffii]